MTDPSDDIEDIEACAREGRSPRAVGPYRVSIGDALFSFRPVIVEQPLVTGRALRQLAALNPPEHHACFAVFTDGLLEEIRLEESVDLRAGVERFVAFKSDRIFRFTINGAEYQWGGAFITGATVLKLAHTEAHMTRVLLRQPDGSERVLAPSSLVDLSEPGVEEFLIG